MYESLEIDRLGAYRLVEKIGVGAMGTVFLAEEEGERVALKVIHPHLVERSGFFRRFQRGALGDSPAFQDTLQFQSEVIVKAACLVLLDHKPGLTGIGNSRLRFWCMLEISLTAVFFETHILPK